MACGLIEAGSLAQAHEHLQLAQRVGEEALYEEDLEEDEVALEMAPITAQLAYVADRWGPVAGRQAGGRQLVVVLPAACDCLVTNGA